MQIKVIGDPSFEGLYEIERDTYKSLYRRIGGKKQPKFFQVGGPLGKIYTDYDINNEIDLLDLQEKSIGFFTDVCAVDFMKFMLRFTIRELNLVTESIMTIYKLVDDITTHKISASKFEYLLLEIDSQAAKKGEQLLKRNLKYLLKHFEEEVLEHLNGYCRESICRGLFDAQCINACPAHINIPGFVALMKDGNTQEAYKLMRQENPLSSICGSVCARPCEIKCRRGEITSTVGVRALQRFISIDALKSFDKEACLEDNHNSIGIIGGGPAGLTAAYYLRRTGYDVTVYEKQAYAGGMLAFGIPSYRLPNVTIKEEIETIETLGVKIMTNYHVDQEKYNEIKNKHQRILLATGTTIGRKYDIQHEHVISGIEYLKGVRLSNMKTTSTTVVIGGGDVALDCARTAIRQGSEVTVISLESFDEMPASDEEKRLAKEEGVQFKSGFSVVTSKDNTLFLKRCLSVFDDAGKFAPIFDSCSDTISAETVIMCIGQRADTSYLLEAYQPKNYMLSDNVYVCGDMIKPTIVIDAIAQGKRVAEMIHESFGRTEGLYVGEYIEIPEKTLNIRTFDDDLRMEVERDASERIHSFDEVTKAYTIEDAVYEANRCMRCDRNSKTSLLLGRERQ